MIILYLALFASILIALKAYRTRANLTFSRQLNYNKQQLIGKNAVLIDDNSGIIKQVFLQLVSLGCNVIIGSKDTQKYALLISQALLLHKKHRKYAQKQPILQYIHVDINQKKSIEEFAKKIPFQKIHYLVNKVTVNVNPEKFMSKNEEEAQQTLECSISIPSEESIQIQNHLGYFYLTYLLIQKLQKSQFFRIVNFNASVSSKKNHAHSKQFSILNTQILESFNVIFTKALAERLDSTLGIAVSVNSSLVRTQIQISCSPLVKYFIYFFYPIYYLFTKSDRQGGQTILYMLIKNDKYIESGGYYENCQRSKQNPLALNPQNWQKLWQACQKSLGITFEIL